MKHYIVSKNTIEPWNTSNFTWPSLHVRQILTVYRGLALFLGYEYPIYIGIAPQAIRNSNARLNGNPTKKNWSKLVETIARTVLSDDRVRDYRPVDHVPWEIHQIDDRAARESAVKAYLKESEIAVHDVDVRFWNAFFRRTEVRRSSL